jgi:hypothetical protein
MAALKPDPLLPEYRYNPALRHGTGGYIDARGRAVSAKAVRGQLDRALDGIGKSMRALSESYRSGAISLAEWQTGMMQGVKDAHLIAGAMERGGWAQMTQADFGRVGQIVKGEYAYLRNFADEVAGGLPLDGRFTRRADMYAQAARSTYYNFTEREAERRGFAEERNVLEPGDNCEGCLEETDRGWVALGELVPVGGRTCLTGCRCSIEYRDREGNEVSV